jgi:hypothetical protein
MVCLPGLMASARQILIPLAVLTMGSLLSTQSSPLRLPPIEHTLVLEIIPAKHIYLASEALIVKYRFTNQSDKAVCFPSPDVKAEDEGRGYVRTDATNSKGEFATRFLEGFYPRGRTDQQLLNEANENWIKLAPGLSYVTGAARPLGSLSPGDWQLHSKYVAPELHGRASLVTDALGCTPPQVGVVSKSVTINVATGSGNQ